MARERLKQFLSDSSWSLTGVAIAFILDDILVAMGIAMAIACYAFFSAADAA